MKQSYLPPLAAASLFAALLAGCGGRSWIGIMVGDPTGLCFRQEISRDEAVALGLDVGRLGDDVVHFFVDWIRYEPGWQGRDFSVYWGLGVDFASWTGPEHPFGRDFETSYVAARIPLGLELEVSRRGDVVLFLQLVPKVPFEHPDLHFDGALGLIFGF